MPTLTKPCNCRWCKQPMAAGEPFQWVKGWRPVHGFTKGAASGTTGKIEAWKPAHAFDCLAQKTAADRAAYVDQQCAMLSDSGAQPEKVAELRAHLETRT